MPAMPPTVLHFSWLVHRGPVRQEELQSQRVRHQAPGGPDGDLRRTPPLSPHGCLGDDQIVVAPGARLDAG